MIDRSFRALLFAAQCLVVASAAHGADLLARRTAAETVTAEDLRRHAGVLADDTFEGRETGTRGGRAAAGYIEVQFKKFGLQPAGDKKTYFQIFNVSSRNVLGLLEGSDPTLKNEVVLVGAHFDHVGYGNARTSYGPTGHIHNGADDNASGAATLLELAEACAQLEPRPKRSILFACWDGEEQGLLGSKHWVSRPTIALNRIRVMLNMDMVGRLRNNTLEMIGVRSAAGFRKLASRPNADEPMVMDFTWEMKDNSDHHTFFARGIPILMPHTGLHSDYHRPSDDVEKLNIDGMRRIARYMFLLVTDLADEPELPHFRATSRRESPYTRQTVESLLPAPPGRLGLNWDPKDTTAPGLKVVRVAPGGPAAAAGIRAGDRLLNFAGQEITADTDLAGLVLAAATPPTITVARTGAEKPLELTVQLRGRPTRLGLSWREDDAEPGSVKLVQTTPGSAAARAGLRPLDRIYAVNGHEFARAQELLDLFNKNPAPYELAVERNGHIRTLTLNPVQVMATP